MLELIFNIILISFISFIPIVIWAYIFSYIDNNLLNKKRFLVGIIGGGLSVFPILYMDKILSFFNFKYLDTFNFVYKVDSFFSSLKFVFSLELFLFFIVLFSFLFGLLIYKNHGILKVYARNFLVFVVFVAFIGVLTYGLSLIGESSSLLNLKVENAIYYETIVFNSIKLIIFYYLIVAFIEEASKHFNFLQSSVVEIKSVKTGVLYAIFIALGFSLIENILYFYSLYNSYGFSGELVKIYFFRSVFSIMVHVFCSSIVAYYFSKALLLYRKKDLSFPYLKIFLTGLFLAIVGHLVFDVTLTLGFGFVLFIYFIFGYFYLSSIFYKN